MKHPIDQMNINQGEFLKGLPEGERAFHQQMFRIGNAAYCYHNNAQDLEPSERDFLAWTEGLPEQIRSDMTARGFEDCKRVLSFTRYVNEKNDIGMEQWMKQHLSAKDFEVFISGRDANRGSKKDRDRMS